ncbi:MAG: OmpA family protein [Spirochaetes bacterium]|nr:OmpA family protein [Spirochaetota bacterium]
MQKILHYLFLFSLLILVISGCKKESVPPQVDYSFNYEVFSPNQDGIQDELKLTLNIKTDHFIRYWQYDILDANDQVIKTKKSEGNLADLQKKGFHPKESIEYPTEIVWDGTDEAGNKVKDGQYFFKFIVMDNNRNIVTLTDKDKLVTIIDTVKPKAEYKLTNAIFSPNEDGKKDSLLLDLTTVMDKEEYLLKANKDQKWVIEILNNQLAMVAKTDLPNQQDLSFEWKGLDNNSQLAEDGYYSIKIHSTDKGGNYFEETIPDIKLSTKEYPVEIKVAEGFFSPNGDGKKDTIDFELTLKDKSNISTWELSIVDKNNKLVNKITNGRDIPNQLTWDGKTDKNMTAAEGLYLGRLSVVYDDGSNPVVESQSFQIDVTKPSAEISISPAVFSPDNNEVKDKTYIDQKASEEKTAWTGVLVDEQDNAVKTIVWEQSIPAQYSWDGKDDNDQLSPDGTYYYILSCTDLAGNEFQSEKNMVAIYTEKTPVSVTNQYPIFSPSENGQFDQQTFTLTSETQTENQIVSWELALVNEAEEVIFSNKENSDLPSTIVWDGKSNEGNDPVEGMYVPHLKVNYFHGTTSMVTGEAFLLDITPPVVDVKRNVEIFSPDDDGENDQLVYSITEVKEKTPIKKWELLIYSPDKQRVFKTFTGEGEPTGQITWDGKSDKGLLVESIEDYPVTIIAEDTVGNVLTKELPPIPIDILVIKLPDGRYKIRISSINFRPNSPQMTSDKKNTEIINRLAQALKKFPTHKILLEGYANKYGVNLSKSVEERALKLSQDRAFTIAKLLSRKGISMSRMTVKGRGFENQIIKVRADMTKEEREEMKINRRVEFYLSK